MTDTAFRRRAAEPPAARHGRLDGGSRADNPHASVDGYGLAARRRPASAGAFASPAGYLCWPDRRTADRGLGRPARGPDDDEPPAPHRRRQAVGDAPAGAEPLIVDPVDIAVGPLEACAPEEPLFERPT